MKRLRSCNDGALHVKQLFPADGEELFFMAFILTGLW